jgi:F-type H+-transporting ATPase subunit delta
MITGSLARRYAKAVFALGNAQGNLDKLGADLRSLANAMTSSAELTATLTSPALARSDRKKVIDAILDRIAVQPMTRNLINLMADGHRLATVPALARELDKMIEDKAGRVAAELVSAKPLDPSQLSQITAALEKLSGKQVTIARREDPELLGGVVAKVGDVVYDGSLRTQLRALRDDLAK